ncbi:hypothetical protein BMR07_13090 [Methylococcaceae bacterium CS1]|nr:hypothetical protein BMR07_13090 [Methylococcaceae bacterium CS1]
MVGEGEFANPKCAIAREGGKELHSDSRQAMCGSLNGAGFCCVVEADAGRTRAQMIRRVANRFL